LDSFKDEFKGLWFVLFVGAESADHADRVIFDALISFTEIGCILIIVNGITTFDLDFGKHLGFPDFEFVL
jgi:hypothetical protein